MKLCRLALPALLILLLGVDFDALALPRDPAPRPALRAGGPSTVLVAQRRRRRRHTQPAPKPRPRPKAAVKPEPVEQPEQPSGGGGGGGGAAAAAADPNALQRGGRVEFDGRLVQGQTAKSGAIYLFARQRTDLRSMVRERDSYRREVLRTVYPDWTK